MKKKLGFEDTSIKKKLTLIVGLMTIIPLVIVGLVSLKIIEEKMTQAIHKEHSLVGTRLSQNINELVKTIEISLETIGTTNPELFQENLGENKENILYGILRNLPYLEEVSIMSSRGEEIYKTSKRYVSDPDKKAKIEEERLRVYKEGKIQISKPNIESDNQILFNLGVPIGGGASEFLGVICVKVSLRQVVREMSNMDILKGSYIMLVDDEGSLIGNSDYSQVLRREDVSSSLGVIRLKSLVNLGDRPDYQFETATYRTYTGEEVLGVFGLIPKVDWGVVIEQPLANAYGEMRSMMLKLILTLVVTIGIIIYVVFMVVNKFIEPIEELSKGVQSVKDGNLDYEIPKYANDEIGMVIEGFNSMTKEVKKRRENEKLIMEAEKKAAIGSLAAGVAHEINNPMNNLSFYAVDLLDLLDHRAYDQAHMEEVIKEYLEIIKEQVDRCSDITSNLLRFSRESTVESKKLDLDRVMDNVLKLMDHRIKSKKIRLKKDYSCETCTVIGDESQIQQVLLNILVNAADAVNIGGCIKIGMWDIEDYVQVEIEDDGMGIKDEIMSQIFNPFFTTKPIGEGTGLGLSISQAIIDRMRGHLRIISKEGKGTKVIISLPIAREVV